MIHAASILIRRLATIALLCVLTPSVYAATLYVANTGVNGTGCGTQTTPCRSITWAIVTAAPGDTIIVGPGRYGDLNDNGVLDEAGEEIGLNDCPPLTLCPICCVVRVNKAVTVLSSHGAASTVIDGRSADVAQNVLVNGGEFGRPGKGFLITNTKRNLGDGLVINGANVKVRGNQVLATLVYPFTGQQPFPRSGISALLGGPILIEGNQVVGQWSFGISARGTDKTVRKNQVSVSTGYGIDAQVGPVVTGNIVIATGTGLNLEGEARAVSNAVYGNTFGIRAEAANGRQPVIERNNIVSSPYCGMYNQDVSILNATNNYWGAASGPGPDPADQVCNDEETTTVTTPFATTPFIVKAPIKP